MVVMVNLRPDGQLGESGGSKDTVARKGGESDVASRDHQGGSPHPCCLRTNGLAPMSKY
jgi:hypothetical protein